MKTFKRAYCPESISHNGKVYVMDGAASATGKPKTDSVKVIVTNRKLKGIKDLHGNPYPSSVFYFVPQSSN